MRTFGLCVGFGLLFGCSTVGLDGLTGGRCDGNCDDASAATDSPSNVDGSVQESGGVDAAVGVDATSPLDASEPPPDSEPAAEAAAVDGAAEVGTVCTPTPPPSLNDCTGIAPMPAAPVIDGVLDCGVALWDMPEMGWSGTGPLPSSFHSKIAVAYRPDGLYVFVHVTGAGPHRYPPPAGSPGLYCGDAVELFVDDDGAYANPPSYDDPGTIQLMIASPPDSMTTQQLGQMWRDGNPLGAWSGQFIAVRTADGWDAEAFVVAADLGRTTWSLASGAHIGLDATVDFGDPAQTGSCPTLGQYYIQLPIVDAACDQASCNVAEFCDPALQ